MYHIGLPTRRLPRTRRYYRVFVSGLVVLRGSGTTSTTPPSPSLPPPDRSTVVGYARDPLEVTVSSGTVRRRARGWGSEGCTSSLSRAVLPARRCVLRFGGQTKPPLVRPYIQRPPLSIQSPGLSRWESLPVLAGTVHHRSRAALTAVTFFSQSPCTLAFFPIGLPGIQRPATGSSTPGRYSTARASRPALSRLGILRDLRLPADQIRSGVPGFLFAVVSCSPW